jgi:hypothetical protein
MFVPLASAALSLAAGVHGSSDRDGHSHGARRASYALAIAAGLVGTAFHFYNIGKRTGGFSTQSLFYAAPIGAPAALSLTGLLGAAAERVRDNAPGIPPEICGVPAGRAVAGLCSAGLFGTVGEAGLMHLRGAYHNLAMYLPIGMPPIAAALLAGGAMGAPGRDRRFTRWWLRLTALLGFLGAGLHAYGVSRGMGGWRNWSQNVLNGPPLFAPPSFTALSLAGLASLTLLKEGRAHD